MFQKQKFSISFEEEYTDVRYAFRALDDTFLFLVQQQTKQTKQNNRQYIKCNAVLLHTDTRGKVLFRKTIQSQNTTHVYLKMASPKQVVVQVFQMDSNNKTICVIDLQLHKEWSASVNFPIDKTVRRMPFYSLCFSYFKDTHLILCHRINADNDTRQLMYYYSLDELKENNSKPVTEWEHSLQDYFQGYCPPFVCNNNSKVGFVLPQPSQTVEFQYLDLRNNPKGELRKVKANNGVNIRNYYIDKIWEVNPNVYFVICKKKEFKKGPLYKHCIVDASKDEQSATVRGIQLPFNNDPKHIQMQKEHPDYCIQFFDFQNLWVFRLQYQSQCQRKKYAALYSVRRDTLELISTEEFTCVETDLISNFHIPHFLPFYQVDIEKQKGAKYKDFLLKITTLFSLREISLHFLLELNQDFDDDLLMEAIDLIE